MALPYATLAEAWGSPASLKKSVYKGKREVENNTYMKQPVMMVPSDKPALGDGPQTNNLERLSITPSGAIKVTEGFESSQYNFGGDPPTYASRANDYKLGCSMYGVCSPVEGFQSATTSSTSASPLSQSTPQLPGSGAGSGGCDSQTFPLLGDMYSDQIKTAMTGTMNAQLAQNTAPGSGYIAPPNYKKPVDMSKVSGFYDEEIESYLHSMAPVTPFMTVEQEVKGGQDITKDMIPFPNNNPVSLQPSYPSGNALDNGRKPGPPPNNNPYNDGILESINRHLANLYAYNPRQNWWDLTLYILAGIFVIFVLEQLFQVAATIGMRRTITQLEPYLQELANLKRV